MNKQLQIIPILKEQGLMPLFFNADESDSVNTVEALYNGGVKIIEYTNRGPQALSNFVAIKNLINKKFPDLLLGAGTIKDAQQAKLFIHAGADFLVSPAFDMDVYNVALANKILWIPGCMTPTEILNAEKNGIELVKLFPGNLLGPSFVRAIKDIFPTMLFMPTGGVDTSIENLESWFGAGVTAVGLGSGLITEKILNDRNFNYLTSKVKEVLDKIIKIKIR